MKNEKNWKMGTFFRCVVKADSDNVLHLDALLRKCAEFERPTIFGYCNTARFLARENSRWAVPEYVYPVSR